LLIVDTRASHEEARELVDELKGLSSEPVRWIINTHYHWDHVYGNAVFEDAEIWGHELCQTAMNDIGEEMKESAKQWLPAEQHAEIDAVRVVPPQKVFSDEVSIDIGREVSMTYHGLAHTDSDIVVRIPGADVAYFGDVLEEGAPPNFGDSYPVDWPLSLRLAAEILPSVVVPGHGDVVDRAFVETQHAELVRVADQATSYVTGEMSLEEATAHGPYSVAVMKSALVRAAAVA
jgi:glyoxylase-like metal-dependent hydrolase (beta-lactamase superfamily II)